MSTLENVTLRLLEKINSRYVCISCMNRGGEGKHAEDCDFFSVLKAWREKAERR